MNSNMEFLVFTQTGNSGVEAGRVLIPLNQIKSVEEYKSCCVISFVKDNVTQYEVAHSFDEIVKRFLAINTTPMEHHDPAAHVQEILREGAAMEAAYQRGFQDGQTKGFNDGMQHGAKYGIDVPQY